MNQNYNSPVLFLDVNLAAADSPSDEIANAFKAAYPTFREAKQFVIAGGSIFYRTETETEGGLAVVYLKGEAGGVGYLGTTHFISLTLGDYGVDVEYEESAD